MDIHAKLHKLMDDRGWTEYKLSKMCGLSESTLANIFRRNTMPSITTLETICNGFGITLSQFFSENEMIEISPDYADIFCWWMSLTKEEKDAVANLIQTFKRNR